MNGLLRLPIVEGVRSNPLMAYMNYKRKSPARKKSKSEYRHGLSSEGKAKKAKVIKQLADKDIFDSRFR